MLPKAVFISLSFLLLAACQQDEGELPTDSAPIEKAIPEVEKVEISAVQDTVISIESTYSIRDMSGCWFSDESVQSKEFHPDIDGLFDVDTIKMRRFMGRFKKSFNGLVFWLDSDSSLKVACNYVPSDERKQYWDRYSSSYFEVSIWHHSAEKNSLILEFHFYDGIKEVSEIHYSIRARDKNNIFLIRNKNEFWVEGEEI
ncbi:hypothetical protein JYT72_00165 [Crocinitomix catalasitica]|nr:hypothetical protein [Crocinitomix catalasitica]